VTLQTFLAASVNTEQRFTCKLGGRKIPFCPNGLVDYFSLFYLKCTKTHLQQRRILKNFKNYPGSDTQTPASRAGIGAIRERVKDGMEREKG